jgi:CheY-like chemotaxis protein
VLRMTNGQKKAFQALRKTVIWEVQGALRSDSRTAHIPIIVCLVLPDQELAFALKAAEFLPKPVTRPALLRTLDRVFSGVSATVKSY